MSDALSRRRFYISREVRRGFNFMAARVVAEMTVRPEAFTAGQVIDVKAAIEWFSRRRKAKSLRTR